MKITYYGHSCFGVEINEKYLLFDPFISPNKLAKHIETDAIMADFILITHGHEDHVADTVKIAKRTGATVISNYEIVTWFGSQGITNGHPMNHGGEWKFDFGKVKYVNAVHSSVLPDGTYGGNPGGYVVKTSEGNFYFAGDTALTYDMKIIGEFEKIGFAMLPVGNNFTMGIEDAVLAAGFIKCSRIIAMHYDTFPYIVIDKNDAKEKFSKAGVELIIMDVGGDIDL